ncbi:hypothetical protein GCM10010495_17960 [Kitasatospora herbaricolor]|uniref:helix-turn-helix domain-containing protein n=1 Tax=Kitasatospora herbaricolor TaxID=68217 RepID=UPI00174BB09A|nr:helix-turn-helix domain-containing protein [Kitasatospora herbaricolor]MDQ0308244.1 hypothetical protein [Kitasatospora herbaricolor]GGV06252.1 hypothetical protein GCM10010495_17960 [Kitasatospora herbaricolor]
MQDESLTPAQAAVLVNVTEKTLSNWRYLGVGPTYRKLSPGRGGRVRYSRRGVEKWLDAQTIAA